MKGFIAGLLVGAAALAIGQRLIHPTQPVSDLGQSALVVSGPVTPQIALAPDPICAAPSSKAKVTLARPPENPLVSAKTSTNSAVAVDAENRDMEQECSNWYTRKSKREQAAREAEAKDTDWAYSMEQLLQQHAATHPQGRKFEIKSVDCRTTYCRVKAVGHTDRSAEAFQQVMQEAMQAPWSQFSQRSEMSSGGSGENTITLEFVLSRR
jgi:hypothetical protein